MNLILKLYNRDIWIDHIFSILDVSDLARFEISLTNSHLNSNFREICESRHEYRIFYSLSWSPVRCNIFKEDLLYLGKIKWLSSHHIDLSNLQINVYGPNSTNLHVLVKLFPDITSIIFTTYPYLNGLEFQSICERLPNMKKCEIYNIEIMDESIDMMLTAWKQLNTLKIYDGSNLSDLKFSKNLLILQNIEIIELYNCYECTEELIKNISFRLPNLIQLTLTNICINSVSCFRNLHNNCINLLHINLSYCNLTDESIDLITLFYPNLIYFNGKNNENYYTIQTFYYFIERCHKIENLLLESYNENPIIIEIQTIELFVLNCCNIIELDLFGYLQLNDICLLEISRKLLKLKKISFTFDNTKESIVNTEKIIAKYLNRINYNDFYD